MQKNELVKLVSIFSNKPVYMNCEKLHLFLTKLRMGLSHEGDADIKSMFFFPFDDEGQDNLSLVVNNGVAEIPIIGPLTNLAEDDWLVKAGIVSSYQTIKRLYSEAVSRKDVNKIAYYPVESPGGEGDGLFDTMDELNAMRASSKKETVAVVNEAFSAAYGLISTADSITISRSSGVGSIGSIIAHEDVSEMDKMDGISYEYFTYGKKKAQFSSHQPLSADAKEKLNNIVETHGKEFVSMVADNIGQSFESVRSTEADIFFGQEAVDIGLANNVLPLQQAIDTMRNESKNTHGKGVNSKMDIKTLMQEDPEGYEALKAEMLNKAKTALASDPDFKKGIMEEMKADDKGSSFDDTEIKATIESMQATIAGQQEQLKAYEKAEAIREMQMMETQASGVWGKLLNESVIPEKFHEKVKKQIDYKSFINETKFDIAAFSEKAAAEIKEWEPGFVNEDGDSILGFGVHGSDSNDAPDKAKIQARANKLLSLAGQKVA